MSANSENSTQIRETIRKCLRFVLPADSRLPEDDEDWITGRHLDSMGHVDLLLCVEKSLGYPNLFGHDGADPPRTTRSAVEIVRGALVRFEERVAVGAATRPLQVGEFGAQALLVGWGTSLGGVAVPSNLIDAEFGLPAGTLKERAGIETIRRAAQGEDEVFLAMNAARGALQKSGCSTEELDWILATSETFQGFPAFAACIHSSLLAPQSCRSLDIGGGCTGIAKSFAVAQSFLSRPGGRNILVVSSDVHSRILAPGKVPGEFGGLFGDGACAFLISRDAPGTNYLPYSIHSSVGGCAGMYSSALQLRRATNESIVLDFHGEALAQAAIDLLEKTISELEIRSGKSREDASAFALHQPNHRVTEILLRRAKLPRDKVPLITKFCGNLGASTSGAALGIALDLHSGKARNERGLIFLAAVAPGIVWDGVLLD